MGGGAASQQTQQLRNELLEELSRRGRAHPAEAAEPVLVETGGTGQWTGGGDPASEPAAGAATTAGCPATQHEQENKYFN